MPPERVDWLAGTVTAPPQVGQANLWPAAPPPDDDDKDDDADPRVFARPTARANRTRPNTHRRSNLTGTLFTKQTVKSAVNHLQRCFETHKNKTNNVKAQTTPLSQKRDSGESKRRLKSPSPLFPKNNETVVPVEQREKT